MSQKKQNQVAPTQGENMSQLESAQSIVAKVDQLQDLGSKDSESGESDLRIYKRRPPRMALAAPAKESQEESSAARISLTKRGSKNKLLTEEDA